MADDKCPKCGAAVESTQDIRGGITKTVWRCGLIAIGYSLGRQTEACKERAVFVAHIAALTEALEQARDWLADALTAGERDSLRATIDAALKGGAK